MPRLGTKNISYAARLKMVRKTPKKMADYDSPFVEEHRTLIEAFTKDEYLQYEKLIHSWGTPGRSRQVMLDLCIKNNITGPVLDLATIRNNNLSVHQKLIQIIRSRWTTIYEYKVEKINSDPEKFWEKMGRGIQRRAKDDNRELYPLWEGKDGLVLLVAFLKELYAKQQGLCAISRDVMALEISTGKGKQANKCSPDRKNSNKGYTPDNIWLVTWWANHMKLDSPMITFNKRVRMLYETMQSKSVA